MVDVAMLSAVNPVLGINSCRILYIMFRSVAKSSFSFALTKSRSIYLFSQGSGVYGALGQGNSLSDSPTFQEVPLTSYCAKENAMVENTPTKISAGWGHSAAITDRGKLFIFGRPFDFSNLMQLNRLSKVSKSFTRFVARSTNSALFGNVTGYFPTPSEVANMDNVTDVCCSAGLTLFISNGDVYGFGLNKYRQCGVDAANNKDIHIYEPAHISTIPEKCKQVAAGLQHGLALTEQGAIYAWGKGHHGQLGNGTKDVEAFGSLPVRVVLGAESRLATKITAGFGHSVALAEDGSVYVWGKNMADVLKDGSRGDTKVADNQMTPRRIELPNGRKAVNIVSSNFHVVIEANDRTLWIIGMEEIERNSAMQPLQVQSDFHRENGDRIPQEELDNEGDDVIRNINVILPPGAMLKGSYHRVVVVYPNEERRWVRESDGGAAVSQGVYDIVLYKGEAYYKEVDLVSQFDSWLSSVKVVDYCRGWQHSLIAAEITANQQ